MRFLFVDKITTRTTSSIHGQTHFTDESPFRIPFQDGSWVIAPGVVGEAIGQLVSWLVIEQTQFKFRPVFAFIDKVEILGIVPPGSQLHTSGTIDQLNDESVIFSGTAMVEDKVVQRVTRCTNFFMPLEKTEFESDTRKRFSSIVSDGGGTLNDRGVPCKFADMVQNVKLDQEQGTATAHCKVPVGAPFYNDHFPRFPVTPIVVINEIIALAISRLLGVAAPNVVIPKQVKNLKIKSFICPGEEFQITVKRKGITDGTCEAMVTVTKEGRKILQGLYCFSDAVSG